MDRFVARQPIFDTARSVHAYELLFRTGLQNAFPVGFSPEAPADALPGLFSEAVTWARTAIAAATQKA